MKDIKIDDTWRKADEEVIDRMGDYYNTMKQYADKYDTLKAAVHEMRDKQKLYFKTRAFNILDESKAAEKKVDDILSGKSEVKQNALF